MKKKVQNKSTPTTRANVAYSCFNYEILETFKHIWLLNKCLYQWNVNDCEM